MKTYIRSRFRRLIKHWPEIRLYFVFLDFRSWEKLFLLGLPPPLFYSICRITQGVTVNFFPVLPVFFISITHQTRPQEYIHTQCGCVCVCVCYTFIYTYIIYIHKWLGVALREGKQNRTHLLVFVHFNRVGSLTFAVCEFVDIHVKNCSWVVLTHVWINLCRNCMCVCVCGLRCCQSNLANQIFCINLEQWFNWWTHVKLLGKVFISVLQTNHGL